MKTYTFHTVGHTDALRHAALYLQESGWKQQPAPDAADFLILPVPSFDGSGHIIGATHEIQFPQSCTVIGGKLSDRQLSAGRAVDLLQDPIYLAKNAAITAQCAVKLAMTALPVTMQDCTVLVIGWGRIGKCLATLLKAMGAAVTVAARNPADRAIALALGFRAISTDAVDLSAYRLIYNTVPVMLFPHCPEQPLKIDLASRPGLGGSDVICARGLPNLHAPESSGKLIADSIIRIVSGKEYTQ